MWRIGGALVVLVACLPACASGPDEELLFDGDKLQGIKVHPAHRVEGGVLVIDATTGGTLQTARDLGSGFELDLVCRWEGKNLPYLGIWTKRFMGAGYVGTTLPAAGKDPGGWHEFRIVCEPDPVSGRLVVTVHARDPGSGEEVTREVGRLAGDRPGGINLGVGPGDTLLIREARLRVIPTPWPYLRVAAGSLVVLLILLAVALAVRRIRRGMRQESLSEIPPVRA
jgi:hypothetical protein